MADVPEFAGTLADYQSQGAGSSGATDPEGQAQDLKDALANAPANHPLVNALKTAGWWMTELVPGVAAARHRESVARANQQAHLKNAMNLHLISTALGMAKEGDTTVLQDKNVMKAFESTMGPMGIPFMHVAGALAQRSAVHKQGFLAIYNHNVQQGMNPTEALHKTAAIATSAGLEIPTQFQSLLARSDIEPEIAAAREQRMRPEKVETARATTQEKINVQTDPTNVERQAAAGAIKTGEATKARELAAAPFKEKAGKEREAAAVRKEQRAEARELSKEERAQAAKLLGSKAAAWGKVRPDGTIDHSQNPAPTHSIMSAAAAGYAPFDPKSSDGGIFHKLMQSTGLVAPAAHTEKKKSAAEQALDIINNP